MAVLQYVCESPRHYVHHDQLFKRLLHTFFGEFLELFFPEVYHYVDLKSLKLLSEEMFTDLIDGESRRADIVIEASVKGEESFIIIHVEPQNYVQPNFNERMYQYFCLLYNKYRKPILPIALFGYKDNRTESNEFTLSFPFFHVLTFQFLTIELRKLNWKHFVHSSNPVAAALLSKMGFADRERIQVKKEFLIMLVKMKITPAKQRLIIGFFESYLKLNDMEENELMEEIKTMDPEEAEEILKLPNSWMEKGIEKGIEVGIEKGIEKGKRDIALEMIKEGLSTEIISKITKLSLEEITELKKHNY